MAERRAEELESRQQMMQSQVETSLTQSNEKMSEILRQSRSLEGERQLLVERTEKLKLAQTRITNLEKELSEKKEALSLTEKQRASLRLEKSELEDKEYNLANRLRQTEVRF